MRDPRRPARHDQPPDGNLHDAVEEELDGKGEEPERGRRIALAAVDDHPALLSGVERVLTELAPEVDFVGTGATVAELLATLEADARPADVVLLDLRLPSDRSRPMTNVRALTAAGAAVVIYTEGTNAGDGREALRAGALTVVYKDDPIAVLVEAVRQASVGRTAPTRALAALLHGEPWLDPGLSDQEREALRLYAGNMPAKSVARRMGVAESTVKKYISRARAKYHKVGRRSGTKLDLHQRAIEDGIIDTPSGPDTDRADRP